MRVEPYAAGSYLHVVKRGARGMPIVNDAHDKRRFLRILNVMNDEYYNENWEYAVQGMDPAERPTEWPVRKPLTSILAYTLMPNHFHLILKETIDGGVSTFMQKLGQSMTVHFNAKYKQRGSIFQGSYRSRTIENDSYFRYALAYVLVKNTFELYPKGGLKAAVGNFNDAWEWAIRSPDTSLGSCMTVDTHVIIDRATLLEVFDLNAFKRFARDVILGGKWTIAEFE